jgi:hypothetical protein
VAATDALAPPPSAAPVAAVGVTRLRSLRCACDAQAPLVSVDYSTIEMIFGMLGACVRRVRAWALVWGCVEVVAGSRVFVAAFQAARLHSRDSSCPPLSSR